MKRVPLSIFLVISVFLISIFLFNGCSQSTLQTEKIEISLMLDQFGAAYVDGNVENLITYFIEPITGIYHPTNYTGVYTLEQYRSILELMFASVDILIDEFLNKQITIVDSNNAIVEADEHVKRKDKSDNTITETIDKVKLILIRINGIWKISIYEVISTTPFKNYI